MNVKEVLKKPYFKLKHNHAAWYYLFNHASRTMFNADHPRLDALQQRLVDETRKRGIAFTTLDELFAGENMLEKLVHYIQPLRDTAKVTPKKDFLHALWDPRGEIDLNNPLTEISIRQRTLDIVNSYLMMYARLLCGTMNVTIPVAETDVPKLSQRWHRDPQEQTMLKMFIYLSDVTEKHGPFTYIQESNYGNKYGKLFPQKPPAGIYLEDAEVMRHIDTKDIIVATGKPGTVIFCDTAGLHRGGYATGGERVMYTAAYIAPSFVEKPWYSKPQNWNTEINKLSAAQRFALDG